MLTLKLFIWIILFSRIKLLNIYNRFYQVQIYTYRFKDAVIPPQIMGWMSFHKTHLDWQFLLSSTSYCHKSGWIFDQSSWQNWLSFIGWLALNHEHLSNNLELFGIHSRRIIFSSFIDSKTSFDVCLGSRFCLNSPASILELFDLVTLPNIL